MSRPSGGTKMEFEHLTMQQIEEKLEKTRKRIGLIESGNDVLDDQLYALRDQIDRNHNMIEKLYDQIDRLLDLKESWRAAKEYIDSQW